MSGGGFGGGFAGLRQALDLFAQGDDGGRVSLAVHARGAFGEGSPDRLERQLGRGEERAADASFGYTQVLL
jgi:hypothetical protein